MADFDIDAYLSKSKAVAPKSAAKGGDDFDIDAYLGTKAEAPKAEAAKNDVVRTVPPRDMEGLKKRIAASQSPLPGGIGTLGEALADSYQAAGDAIGNQALFGLPGKAMRALDPILPSFLKSERRNVDPLPEPGRAKRIEDYIPSEATFSAVPAAATDMATVGGIFGKAGQGVASIPATVARKLGASEVATAVRPSLQTAAEAGGSGALFGGVDSAARGGDLEDVGASMLTGAAGNVAMSQLPAIASKIEDAATNATMSRAVRPLLEIGQGKAANKAQLALGKGDKVAGKEEMRRVVQQEGLEPVIRKHPADLANVVQEKLDEIGSKELGPVRALAYEAEPNAKVPVAKIKTTLQGLLTEERKGTDFHDDVEKAIAMLDERAKKIGTAGQFPIKSLLTNAREFERDGYGKTEPKFRDGESSRAIGRALRDLVDERISKIYMKRPDLVRKALGMPGVEEQPRLLETGADNPDYVPRKPFATTKPGSSEELNLGALGDKYAAARKRYADLKAIEPAAEQLSSRKSQERHGLISTGVHGAELAAGALLGSQLHGIGGTLGGVAMVEGMRRGYPVAQRIAGRLAAPMSGPAVDPRLSGALAGRLSSDPGLWQRYLEYRRQKGEAQ